MAGLRHRIFRVQNISEWIKNLGDNPKALARDLEEFDLHLAAQEWSLAVPLDINSRDDFSCLPRVAVSPFEHQVDNAILFFNRLQPRAIICDDVGLGKTVTAGLIARELLDRRKIETILVVCPKSIMDQWAEEFRSKFGINAVAATGGEFCSLDRHPFWITSYQTALRNMAVIRRRQFDLLILDEAHAVRNLYGTPKPPKVAEAFYSLMNQDGVRYCVMLTATPIQNRLWDIFSQFEILTTPQPNPLGTPGEFNLRFIADKEARRLRPGTEQDFRRRVSMALVRRRRKDVELLFPDRQVRGSLLTPLPLEWDYIMKSLEVILEFPKLVQYTYARSLMSSPWALAGSFEKKAEEDTTLDSGLRRKLQELAREGRAINESAKTRAVVEFARAAAKEGRAQRMIVFTMRLETLRFIAQALERAGFGDQIAVLQGNQHQANRRAIADFSVDPPFKPILLSTDVGAVGLNLQAGNVVINYDLPWNPMVIEQRIGRVQRLGQKAKHVIVHNLVLKGTIEDHVVLRLMEKLNLFNQAIGEMEELLEICGYDEEHRSLEQVIMDLVRKVAEQKDISEDLERMEKSRQAAEAKMHEMREATEKALGAIRPADNGRRLAGLQRLVPRMEVRELVEGCLRRTGAAMRKDKDGRLFVKVPRGEVEFLFDPDDANKPLGHEARLVFPGTKAFDQIVRQVRDGAGVFVVDARREGLDSIARALRDRLAPLGMTVEALRMVERQPSLALRAWFKASATVGTDRYETIVELTNPVPGHGLEEILEIPYIREELEPRGYSPVALKDLQSVQTVADENALRAAAEDNESIAAFCRFYEERFQEDLKRLAEFVQKQHPQFQASEVEELVRRAAESDPAVKTALSSLELRFVPQVELRPVGVCGVMYDVVSVEADVRNLAQKEAYPIRFHAVPVSGRIISDLPIHGIPGSIEDGWVCPGGHIVAAAAFKRCAAPGCTAGACRDCLTGSTPPFSLRVCVKCKRLVCARHSQTCSECGEVFCLEHLPTGRRMCQGCSTELPDGTKVPTREVRVSAVSGRPGRVSDMRKSEISDQWAFPEEMVVCQETGAIILPDESDWCSVTGRRVRRDLLVEDTATGDRVLERLTRPSSVSGRRTLPQHLVKSHFNPEREGLPDETLHCGVCGATVLKDEVLECPETRSTATPDHFETCEWSGEKVLPEGLATCEVTGKRVRRSLLKTCPETGKRAVSDLFERCEESGAEVLPDGLRTSEVSQKRVRRSLLVACEETGRLALPHELGTCSVTGRRVHPDLLYRCPDTGLPLLLKAAATCEESGVPVHPSALALCAATGMLVRRSLLVRDDLTGDLVLRRLAATCELTGKQTLADHLGISSVSGKKVLQEYLRSCEESGRSALPEELQRCERSGKMVHPDLLFKCPETGATLLKRLGQRCQISGELHAPDGLETCEATGLRVARSLLALDEVTGQRVQQRLLQRCERTGRRTTGEHLSRSYVSGALVLRDLLVACEVSGARALPDELKPCVVTGKRVLPSLLQECETSGKQVLVEVLETCQVTGKRVLPEYLSYCHRSDKKALTSLFGRSELSGEAGLAELLQRCEATGRMVFPDELVTLSDGKRVARDWLFACPGCGANVELRQTFRCASCSQIYCETDRAGRVCTFCAQLIQLKQGQPLPPVAIEALRRHVGWIRRGYYILASTRVYVHGFGPLWKIMQKPILMVFSKDSSSLEQTFEQFPLIQRTLRAGPGSETLTTAGEVRSG